VIVAALLLACGLAALRAGGVRTPVFLSSLGPAGFLFGRWFGLPYIAGSLILAVLASLPAPRVDRFRGLAAAVLLAVMAGVMLWMSGNTWVEKRRVKAAYDAFHRQVTAVALRPVIDADFNSQYVLGLYGTMGHACRIWPDPEQFERAMGIPAARVVPDRAAPREEWQPLIDPQGRGVRSIARLDWNGLADPDGLAQYATDLGLTNRHWVRANGVWVGFVATEP
jgi:hypothetical protein